MYSSYLDFILGLGWYSCYGDFSKKTTKQNKNRIKENLNELFIWNKTDFRIIENSIVLHSFYIVFTSFDIRFRTFLSSISATKADVPQRATFCSKTNRHLLTLKYILGPPPTNYLQILQLWNTQTTKLYIQPTKT